MADMFDDIDWHDLGAFGSMLEEFTEEEIGHLRIEREFEKGNNERHDENLDDFFEDDLD